MQQSVIILINKSIFVYIELVYVFILLVAFLNLYISKKSVFFNILFSDQYSKITTSHNQYRTYLLFLAFALPIAEIFVTVTSTRIYNSYYGNYLISLLCLTIYYLSNNVPIINKNLRSIIYGATLLYIFFIIQQLISYSKVGLITTDIVVFVFIIYNLFFTIKQYWLFILLFFSMLIVLNLFRLLTDFVTIMTIIYCSMAAIINHIRHVLSSEKEQQLQFADNVINNGKIAAVLNCLENIF